MILKIMKL